MTKLLVLNINLKYHEGNGSPIFERFEVDVIINKKIIFSFDILRPWRLGDADFVLDASLPLDPRKTVFVGGVPRPLKAGMSTSVLDVRSPNYFKCNFLYIIF